MTDRPDDLLWDLPRADADDDERVPSDDRLRAWRAGRLSELEQRRTEWALARSGPARRRLVELSGVRLAEPPARVRRRVVGRRTPGEVVRANSRRVAVVAASLLVALAVSLVLRLTDTTPPVEMPAGAAFDVAVLGQAVVRDTADTARTRPDGTVRILVEPRGAAVAGLEFGLYVSRDGRLVRLGARDGVSVDSRRGAATLVADARALTGGARAGTHPFWVVVAPHGALPGAVDVADGGSAVALLESRSGGRAYRRDVTVRTGDRPLDAN